MSLKNRVLDAVGFISRVVSENWEHLSFFQTNELLEAMLAQGYTQKDYKKAIDWIEKKTIGSGKSIPVSMTAPVSVRVLDSVERLKITPKAYAYLCSLQLKSNFSVLVIEKILTKAMDSQLEQVDVQEMRLISSLCVFHMLQEEWAQFIDQKMRFKS